MVWEITNDVKNMDRPPIEKVAGLEFEILRYGSDTKASHALLRNLALVEKDPEWKRDIIACTVSWSSRFQEITNECALPKTAAGLAQDTIDVDPTYHDEADEDLANFSKNKQLRAQDYLHIAKGELKTANDVLDVDVTRLKMIVKQHPMSAKAHFVLGSYLGMVGKWRRDRRMLDQGIVECDIAATLFPNWDNPVVEPAIMLSNVGFHAEALKILEQAEHKLGKITPHLAFCHGYTLMELERYQEALSKFEYVIGAAPNYALAYDHAAHCAFKSGKRHDGREYAKKARILGESSTFNQWKTGVYNK